LMAQQLDPIAGAILKGKMEAMGVRVLIATQTRRVLGAECVAGIELADGTALETELVVVSCGIRANSELARDAGLAVNRGIVVDDRMQTADRAVFAVGECAEHRGTVYGLVEPVYEQARVLADVLTDADPEARYGGSRLTTTLKVMGVDLTSMGEV